MNNNNELKYLIFILNIALILAVAVAIMKSH